MKQWRQRQHGGISPVLIVVLAVVVLLGLSLIGSYNGMVSTHTMVQQKAADLDAQMKRRTDLIPNLVATVKGYASHESEVFDTVSKSRAALLSTSVATDPAAAARANASFNSSLGRLLAIAENYPNLKADRNFIGLQDELAGTENRINYARIQYNAAVRDYNLSISTFPNVMLAAPMGFHAEKSFEASESDKAVPTVDFSGK